MGRSAHTASKKLLVKRFNKRKKRCNHSTPEPYIISATKHRQITGQYRTFVTHSPDYRWPPFGATCVERWKAAGMPSPIPLLIMYVCPTHGLGPVDGALESCHVFLPYADGGVLGRSSRKSVLWEDEIAEDGLTSDCSKGVFGLFEKYWSSEKIEQRSNTI